MKTCLIWISFVAVLTASCSVIPKPAVEIHYTLQPAVPVGQGVATAPAKVNLSHTLRIARPNVPLALRGNQLVLIKNNEQTVYAGKAWDAPVPDMLAAALSRDLAATLPRWIIASEASGVRSTYELQTEVRTFATIQNGNRVSVVMDMEVRLINQANRKVLKVLPYHFNQPLQPFTTQQTISAYNQGWRLLIVKIDKLLK